MVRLFLFGPWPFQLEVTSIARQRGHLVRKLFFPIVLGVSGVAVLLYLGFWQLERLAWKEGVLSEIDARLTAAPIDLPAAPTEATDEYSAVKLSGVVAGEELHVLTSGTAAGTGYQVITAVELADGRRVLLDLGLLPLELKSESSENAQVDIVGNLIWPDDVNDSTPAPDLEKNIWFGRDVVAMSDSLGTEPLMVVVAEMSPPDPRLTPLPVDTSTIKNDHWEYAVTWFLLAVVWAAMSLYWIIRTTRQKDA